MKLEAIQLAAAGVFPAADLFPWLMAVATIWALNRGRAELFFLLLALWWVASLVSIWLVLALLVGGYLSTTVRGKVSHASQSAFERNS